MVQYKSVIMTAAVAGILTLSVLAAIPSMKSQGATGNCELTLSANPSKGSLAVGESIDVKLSGRLSCGGSGMVNYPIYITALLSPSHFRDIGHVNTVVNGDYQKNILVKAGTHETIMAAYKPHTNDYVTALTTIDIKEKPSGRFTEG